MYKQTFKDASKDTEDDIGAKNTQLIPFTIGGFDFSGGKKVLAVCRWHKGATTPTTWTTPVPAASEGKVEGFKENTDAGSVTIWSKSYSEIIVITGLIVPLPVYENSALLPLPYKYKASVKHIYLKQVNASVGGVRYSVYQKYAKASSLKGWFVIDVQGSTSQAIVQADARNANNIPATSADFGASRGFLIVMNSSAEGYLFVGGDSVACVRRQLDHDTLADTIVERAAAPEVPAAATAGMSACADYLWTSVYLFGLYNGPNWYYDATRAKGPYDAFETVWDANLPPDAQTGFAPRAPHYHDTWMNGSGFGRYRIPNQTTDGDLCCGLQPTVTDYRPIIDSLSGNLKGGIFICSENGIDANNPSYVTIDGNAWEDQFVTSRLVPGGTFAADDWQLDLWQDGAVENETTDVLYGTWSIQYDRTFFQTVYQAVDNAEIDALAFGANARASGANATTYPIAHHVEAAVGLYNLVGAIKGSVLKLDRTATFVDTTTANKEIYSRPSGNRLNLPAVTPKFAQYFGLANFW